MLEQDRLKLGAAVVVLDADEARTLAVLRRGPWIAKNAQHPRFDSTMKGRDVRRPPAADLTQFVDVLVDRRDVQRIAIVPLLLSKLRVRHTSGHAPTVSASVRPGVRDAARATEGVATHEASRVRPPQPRPQNRTPAGARGDPIPQDAA